MSGLAKVNLYHELYEKLVNDLGIDCIWERAVVCNCINRDTGQPDFTCPICEGSGYRYLQGKPIRVGITGIMTDINQDTLMLREPGTTYCTPKSDVIMGYHDRLRFESFKCVFSEVIKWDFTEDGFGVSHKTYRNIKQPIFLADSKYEYEWDTDFEVTEDTYHLRWKDANHAKLIDGTNMSFLYYTTPTYLVNDLLHELRGTMSDRNTPQEIFRELPKQYQLKREDFVYRINRPSPINSDINTGEGVVI